MGNEVKALIAALRSPDHRQPINPKAVYRTRDVALFEEAANALERLTAPTPSEWRERVARIIDPSEWSKRDSYVSIMEEMVQRGLCARETVQDIANKRVESSLAKADAIASLGGVQDRSSGSVAGCADAQSVLPRRSQGVATPSEGALEALRNHQQQLDQDGVMVGVSRQALDECLAAFAPELTADFTRSLPGGKLDDSEYEAIESALDKADAPCQGPGGRWLTLAERIAALVPEGVAIKPEADGEASKPKARATEPNTSTTLRQGGEHG